MERKSFKKWKVLGISLLSIAGLVLIGSFVLLSIFGNTTNSNGNNLVNGCIILISATIIEIVLIAFGVKILLEKANDN